MTFRVYTNHSSSKTIFKQFVKKKGKIVVYENSYLEFQENAFCLVPCFGGSLNKFICIRRSHDMNS